MLISRTVSVILVCCAALLLHLQPSLTAAQSDPPRGTLRAHFGGLFFIDDQTEVGGDGPHHSEMTFDNGYGVELTFEYRHKKKPFGFEATLGSFHVDTSSIQSHYYYDYRADDTILFMPLDLGMSFYLRDTGTTRLRCGPFVSWQMSSGESLGIGIKSIPSYGLLLGWERRISSGQRSLSASLRYHRIVVEDLQESSVHAIAITFGIAHDLRRR